MSLSRSSCCGRSGTRGKNLDISRFCRHRLAKEREWFSLRWKSVDKPVREQAASFPAYSPCKIIFKLVLWIFLIFLFCSWVNELWNETEVFSALDLMKSQYISIKPFLDTPTYFNLVSIEILPYADLHSSVVFLLQLPASSSIHTPRTLHAFFWTNVCEFKVSLGHNS